MAVGIAMVRLDFVELGIELLVEDNGGHENLVRLDANGVLRRGDGSKEQKRSAWTRQKREMKARWEEHRDAVLHRFCGHGKQLNHRRIGRRRKVRRADEGVRSALQRQRAREGSAKSKSEERRRCKVRPLHKPQRETRRGAIADMERSMLRPYGGDRGKVRL